jgi:hypothetical protein
MDTLNSHSVHSNVSVNDKLHKLQLSQKVLSPRGDVVAIIACIRSCCDVHTTKVLNDTFLRTYPYDQVAHDLNVTVPKFSHL